MATDIITAKIYKDTHNPKPVIIKSQARGNLDLTQFLDLLENMFNMDRPDIVFAPAYPRYLDGDSTEFKMSTDNPTEQWKNTITYKVTRLEPASVGGRKQPFDGDTRELVPRLRQTVNPVGEEKALQIYGRCYDVFVQFDIWCNTNTESEEIANWFMKYMTDRRNLWKHLGIGECIFWWRGQDDSLMNINKKLQTRTLTYYVKYEELSFVEATKLQELEIEVTSKYIREE